MGLPVQQDSRGGFFRRLPCLWHRLEDALLILALAAMVLLPLMEAILRRWFQLGIPSAAPLTQNLVFVVALAGGAVAARQDRLLSLSTLTEFLPALGKTVARLIAYATAAALCVFLAQASWEYWGVEDTVIAGIPRKWILMLMPLGFALVALRLLLHGGTNWQRRLLTAGAAAGIYLLIQKAPLESDGVLVPALTLLGIIALMGMPIFAILGGAALLLFRAQGTTGASIAISFDELVINPTLPAVPLFTLAGYFLAECGASKRLVRVFQAWFGHLRGGAGVMTVLVCAFFTSFTGASGVTILALGGLLMPVLLANRYSERDSLGLLTGAGSLGLLFPPCLPLILYAIIASNAGIHLGVTVSIQQMFLGGLMPGFLLVGLASVCVVLQQTKGTQESTQFSWPEARAALWEAKWELLLPLVAVVFLLSGFATPVEAAAITALYAFVAEAFIHRDLNIRKDAPRVMVECALLIGGVLLILGVAMGLTNYLVDAQVPDHIVDWAKASIHAPWIFLLGLNLLLLIAGCLMDIYSALVVVVPLIVPVGLAFGIDPIHLGVIFLANMQLGFLTPPVGMNLFMTAYRFNKPMVVVVRAVLPMLAIFAFGVLLITYVPALTTLLPRWFQP